jgi:hypothetical protein
MALRVNELRDRLVTERDLTKLWHSFMDLTQVQEFQLAQRPCRDDVLIRRMGEVAAAVARQLPENKIVALTLFEVPPHDLYHGPLTLTRGLGNVFYFKSLDCGLFAMPNPSSTHPSHRWTMARFSIGRMLTRAAGASSN